MIQLCTGALGAKLAAENTTLSDVAEPVTHLANEVALFELPLVGSPPSSWQPQVVMLCSKQKGREVGGIIGEAAFGQGTLRRPLSLLPSHSLHLRGQLGSSLPVSKHTEPGLTWPGRTRPGCKAFSMHDGDSTRGKRYWQLLLI